MLDLLRARRWELFLAAILIVTVVVNVGQSPNYLGIGNFVNLFNLSIEKIIVVIVMTFVIVNGEIDLSVASVMAFSAGVLGGIHGAGLAPFGVAIVIAVVTGTLAGLLQGLVITRFGIPSLVVTLAGLIGFRGAARILLEDRSVGEFPSWFDRLGQQSLLGPLPLTLLLFIAAAAIAGVLLHRTAAGRILFVIGNNAEVARYSGIDVNRTKVWLFVASGTVSAIAGVLFAARLGSVRGDLAQGFELDIITMVLLGGVSIFGGSGNLGGVLLAVFIVLNIRNGLGLANVDANIQTGVIGILLIASVLGQNLLDRLPTRRPSGAEP